MTTVTGNKKYNSRPDMKTENDLKTKQVTAIMLKKFYVG